jgi:alkanesulfonate monooxygenase SsuD/methylene tetrahydromethanopterin reductase-like flavin-dependent oxidoreductase (luciferase family)
VAERIEIGFCFDRTFPAGLVTEVARRLDAGGIDQLWIIEDCFYTAGPSLAAAALSVTDRLTVGLGILPAVARTAPVTAMEIATLCGLGPGRVIGGIGHGVQSWMRQMGVATRSPLTTLHEVLSAVRRLLAGESVTVSGHEVVLDGVRLDQPPAVIPPILAGVRGPKSLAVAGRAADGVLLAEPTSPSYARWALEQAAGPPGFRLAAFSTICVAEERAVAYRQMAPWLARQLDEPTIGLQVLPYYDELSALYARGGPAALVGMPPAWWCDLAAIGTIEDAAAHISALAEAGVGSVGLFPEPDVDIAHDQLEQVLRLAASMG